MSDASRTPERVLREPAESLKPAFQTPPSGRRCRFRLQSAFFRRQKVRAHGVCVAPGIEPHRREVSMKEGIHPNYREVVFVDQSNGFQFVTRSTVQTKESIEIDGKTMPLVKLETTSESHPFYTGTQKSVDNLGGRVEKFRNKFAHLKK
jgi:large subunit ribosomal protein L31